MENYKNVTLNTPGDPAPWGDIENSAFKQIIDTAEVAQNTANTAQDTAEAAQNTANTAQDTAEAAQDTANTANSKPHNSITGLQGGTSSERYHLTLEEKSKIGAGAEKTVAGMTQPETIRLKTTSGSTGSHTIEVEFVNETTLYFRDGRQFTIPAGTIKTNSFNKSEILIDAEESSAMFTFFIDSNLDILHYVGAWNEDVPSIAVAFLDITGDTITSCVNDAHGADLNITTRKNFDSNGVWVEYGVEPYEMGGSGISGHEIAMNEGVYYNDDTPFTVPEFDQSQVYNYRILGETTDNRKRLKYLQNTNHTDSYMAQYDGSGNSVYPDNMGVLGDTPHATVLLKSKQSEHNTIEPYLTVLITRQKIDRPTDLAILEDVSNAITEAVQEHQEMLRDFAIVGACIFYNQGNRMLWDLTKYTHKELVNGVWGAVNKLPIPLEFGLVVSNTDYRAALGDREIQTVILGGEDDFFLTRSSSTANSVTVNTKFNDDLKSIIGGQRVRTEYNTGAPHSILGKVNGSTVGLAPTIQIHTDYCIDYLSGSSLIIDHLHIKAKHVILERDTEIELQNGATFEYERLTGGNLTGGAVQSFWDNTNTAQGGAISGGKIVQRNMYPSSIDQMLTDSDTIRFGLFTPDTGVKVKSLNFIANNAVVAGADILMLGIYNETWQLLTQVVHTGAIAKGKNSFAVQTEVILEGGVPYWFALKSHLGAINYGGRTTYNNDQICRSKWDGSTTTLPADLSSQHPTSDSKTPYVSLKGEY